MQQHMILEIKKLDGVYLANRGTAEFTYVTVLKTVDEFALIKNGEEINDTISIDDLFVINKNNDIINKTIEIFILDSSKVVENQVIY